VLYSSLDEGKAVVVCPVNGALRVIGRVSADGWVRF